MMAIGSISPFVTTRQAVQNQQLLDDVGLSDRSAGEV
jgi:hypothetical protein